MEVNICFLTDNGYVMPTCVAITSMIENKKKETIYNIYLLCINVTKDNEKKFTSLNSSTCKINIINLSNGFKEYFLKEVSATPTAIYKFKIAEILKNLDKVIYLDGDIIVCSDLSELYNWDIKRYYIGAVKDLNGLLKRHYNMFLKNNIFYFNSGVMLMNLKKMRDEKISTKLIEYRLNGYNELMDQDALNFVLREQKIELPFKFNVQTMFMNVNKTCAQIKKYYNIVEEINDFDDFINNATIIHYSPKIKPWKSKDGYKFELWKKYYSKSPFKNEKNSINIKSKPKFSLVKKIIRLIKNVKRLHFLKNFKMKGQK